MSTTIRDAQDAIMEGKSKWQQFKNDFQSKWKEPEEDLQIAKMWKSLPKAVKQFYKDNQPKIYKEMEKKYGGG
jgi:hypothetical protein